MENEFYQKLVKISLVNKKIFLPSVSIDCVIFGFDKSSLKILLLRPINSIKWGLPGHYLRKDEDLRDGANRVLQERTGAGNIFLHQFKTFGKLNRTEFFFKDYPDDLWHKQRFVSVGYYALIDYHSVDPVPDVLSDACEWKDIKELPELMMDHQTILEEALLALQRDLNYKPIGLNLLPEKFTLSEFQKLYEIILDKKLNRGNFYRKMKRYGILEKLNEIRKGGAHKAPDLYRFNIEKYTAALENGLQESW